MFIVIAANFFIYPNLSLSKETKAKILFQHRQMGLW